MPSYSFTDSQVVVIKRLIEGVVFDWDADEKEYSTEAQDIVIKMSKGEKRVFESLQDKFNVRR